LKRAPASRVARTVPVIAQYKVAAFGHGPRAGPPPIGHGLLGGKVWLLEHHTVDHDLPLLVDFDRFDRQPDDALDVVIARVAGEVEDNNVASLRAAQLDRIADLHVAQPAHN